MPLAGVSAERARAATEGGIFLQDVAIEQPGIPKLSGAAADERGDQARKEGQHGGVCLCGVVVCHVTPPRSLAHGYVPAGIGQRIRAS